MITKYANTSSSIVGAVPPSPHQQHTDSPKKLATQRLASSSSLSICSTSTRNDLDLHSTAANETSYILDEQLDCNARISTAHRLVEARLDKQDLPILYLSTQDSIRHYGDIDIDAESIGCLIKSATLDHDESSSSHVYESVSDDTRPLLVSATQISSKTLVKQLSTAATCTTAGGGGGGGETSENSIVNFNLTRYLCFEHLSGSFVFDTNVVVFGEVLFGKRFTRPRLN